MTHSTRRAFSFLLLIGCGITAGCSLQVPKEGDVFGNGGVGGPLVGGNTSTSVAGSKSTGGRSAQGGGTTSASTAGATTTTGTGGTSATAAGGYAGGNTAGGVSIHSAGASSTGAVGGSVATGGSSTSGASGSFSTGGVVAVAGYTSAGGSVAMGGTVSQSSTGGSRAGAGSGAIGGIGQTAGAPTAIGGGGNAATGGAATGGAATGGAATGGAPPAGGAPPQVILQYKFDEGTGDSAVDSTPNHHDGTVSNATWSATGRNGACISYAAADSQVAVPSDLLGTSKSLTISAWVKLTTNAAENRLFYFGTSDGTSYLTLTFNNSTNGISVRFKAAAGTEQVLTTPTQLPLSIWKHVTASVSNVGAALYIDSKIVAQDNTLAMDPTTLGTPMTNLVGSSPTAGQAFQGLIDEFYVYNGILPVSEIQQLAWPKSDYSVYHLDEGTGTSTADSSDRGINGTLTGGATWVPSPFGTAVKLTNSSDPVVPAQQYVTLLDGAIANCTTAITLSAWINLTTNSTDGPVLEFAQSDTLLTNVSTYSTAKGQAVLAHYLLDDSKTFTVRQLGATYTLGQWTHIAAVRGDNSNGVGRFAAVYQNGVQKAVSTNTGTGAYYVSPTPLSYLGRSHIAAMAGFNGEIDEVLVACRQYTDDEIKQLAYRPPN